MLRKLFKNLILCHKLLGFIVGSLRNNSYNIRLATATWCLACFILIQSYSCNLTSVLTVPQFTKPIINSVYDIPKVKNLQVVVYRGYGTDVLLSVRIYYHVLCDKFILST